MHAPWPALYEPVLVDSSHPCDILEVTKIIGSPRNNICQSNNSREYVFQLQ